MSCGLCPSLGSVVAAGCVEHVFIYFFFCVVYMLDILTRLLTRDSVSLDIVHMKPRI